MENDAFFAASAEGLIFGDSDHRVSEPASATVERPGHAFDGGDLRVLLEAAQVVIPDGAHVVHVTLAPGEVVELPFGPDAHFLARLGDGNLAIKVGDVTVILEGYAAAANDPQHPVIVESADGHPLDIATLLASTDPTLDIQTAAGPSGNSGGNPGGQGADNTGAILQQFGAGEGGLGGFHGVGGQGDSTGPDGQPGVGEGGINPPNPPTPGPVNAAPVAPDVFATTDEDTGIFSQLAASDADGNTLHYSLVGPVPAGLTLTDDGKWTFVPTGHFDSLAEGGHTTVSFQYKATDGFLDSNTATVTIGIDGVNDPATFAGDTLLEIGENDTKPVNGQLVINDLDHDQAALATTGDLAGTYGTFSVKADGSWSYTVDNANPTVDGMKANEFTLDTLTVKSIDGTEQTIEVKITGANDPATIAGDLTGSVTEDSGASATGKIVIHDPDVGDAAIPAAGYISQYGQLTLNADGTWEYKLDDTKDAVNKLKDGDTLTDTFSVTSLDGTATQNIVITIHGHDDAPQWTGGTNGLGFLENDVAAQRVLQFFISDPDDSVFTTAVHGALPPGFTYDPATLTVTGTPNGLYDSLAGGEVTHTTVTFDISDGQTTITHDIDFEVQGQDDAPVIGGTGTPLGYTEKDPATAIVGSATISDVDSPNFNGGSLTVSLGATGKAEDQLSIINQGAGAGQIGISGADVTYGGLTIGTWSGGANGADLVIHFTKDDATVAAAQALLRDIAYADSSDNPSAADRAVHITLVDGGNTIFSGVDTGTADATIHVTPVNSAPIAADDIVLTNAGLSSFDLPIPAFLANDHDPEGGAVRLFFLTASGDLTDFTAAGDHLVITDDATLGASLRYIVIDPQNVLSNSAHVAIHNQDGGDIKGTAAHEIIIGSAAVATIDGGGGNDLIFGGAGSETFIYHDGDVVQGGGDASLPLTLDVRGDILAIDHDVDLTKVDLSGFSGIETLSTMEAGHGANTSQTLTLNALDVMTLTNHELKLLEGAPALRVDLEGGDHLYLADNKSGDGWNQVGFGLSVAIYGHEKTLGDSTTYDAYVEVVTPNPGAGSPPNVHVNQDAPTP